MTDSITYDSGLLRPSRLLLGSIAVFALALAGCGDKNAKPNPSTPTSSSTSTSTPDFKGTAYEDPGDHAIGNVDAEVTLVEYASVSCGACGNWHNTVYPEFKKKYVDTGKVRYVFREFLAGDPTLAEAGFKIALCGGKDNYFKNIAFQFKRQPYIFSQAQKGNAREAYIGIAKAAGMNEDEFNSCMANEDHRKHYMSVMKKGQDMGVAGTPAFFINGERAQVFTIESIEEIILPLLGEEIPTADDSETTE